jgi:hypothetical protein
LGDIRRLKREGHELDVEHVMRLMKGSASTGKTGAELAAETAAARRGDPAEPG